MGLEVCKWEGRGGEGGGVGCVITRGRRGVLEGASDCICTSRTNLCFIRLEHLLRERALEQMCSLNSCASLPPPPLPLPRGESTVPITNQPAPPSPPTLFSSPGAWGEARLGLADWRWWSQAQLKAEPPLAACSLPRHQRKSVLTITTSPGRLCCLDSFESLPLI